MSIEYDSEELTCVLLNFERDDCHQIQETFSLTGSYQYRFELPTSHCRSSGARIISSHLRTVALLTAFTSFCPSIFGAPGQH